jgi:hypothetical protein
MKRIMFAVVLGLLVGRQVQADVILDFTGGVTANPLGASFVEGYTFTVNTPHSVDGLAIWNQSGAGLIHSHQVGLWDGAGNLIASATLSGTGTSTEPSTGGGKWVESSMSPLTLVPGQTYTLGAVYIAGDSDQYVANATRVSTVPEVTYGAAVASSISSSLAEPTIPFLGNNYFGPDLVLTPTAVPAPPAVVLVGLGAGCVALKRYVSRRATA